mgnify:CR=1 FL=1
MRWPGVGHKRKENAQCKTRKIDIHPYAIY